MATPPGYKTTAECWQVYPKLPFPDSLGARGIAQKKARDACVAASMRGEADPQLETGPVILRHPDMLWNSNKPWSERPTDGVGRTFQVVGRMIDPAGILAGGFQTGGDRLRTMALGWRPPTWVGESRFGEIEQIGTILGGMDALVAANIPPWPALASRIAKVPAAKLRADNAPTIMTLLGIIQSAGGKALSLDSAATWIRNQVNLYGLGSAAWHARIIRIVLVGQTAQKKRKIVEQAVSTTVSTAGTVLTGTGVAIVGIPLAAVGATMSAAAARTGIEKGLGERLIEDSKVNFDLEMARKNLAASQKLYETALSESFSLEKALIPEALKEAETRAKYIEAGVWVGSVSAVTLFLYALSRKLK